jgi:hypothetical protein
MVEVRKLRHSKTYVYRGNLVSAKMGETGELLSKMKS